VKTYQKHHRSKLIAVYILFSPVFTGENSARVMNVSNRLYEIKAFFKGENEFPVASAGISIAIILVYLYHFLMNPLESIFAISPASLEPFLLNGWLFWEGGEYLRLVTSMFTHFHLAHIGSNLLFFLIYGLRYEELSDSRYLVVVFLLSGIAGNLLTVIMAPGIYSAGSSGAVFGCFGALLVLLRKYYPSGLKTSLFIAFIFFSITIGSDTNIFSHFGGLVTGFTLQMVFMRIGSKSKKDKKWLKTYS